MATANYGRGRRQREAFDGYTFKSIQTGGVRPNVRLGVKLRRTQCEQMSSGFLLKADVAERQCLVRKVPTTAIKQECFYLYDCTVIDRSVQID
jgi:hypothetical protein